MRARAQPAGVHPALYGRTPLLFGARGRHAGAAAAAGVWARAPARAIAAAGTRSWAVGGCGRAGSRAARAMSVHASARDNRAVKAPHARLHLRAARSGAETRASRTRHPGRYERSRGMPRGFGVDGARQRRRERCAGSYGCRARWGKKVEGVMAPKSPPVRASATSPRLGSDPAPGAVAPFTTVHARSGAVRRRSFARLLESRASLPPRAVANRSRRPPGGAQLHPRGYRDGWRRARVSPDRRHRAQACRACRDGHPAERAEWRAAPGPRDQAQP